MGHFLRDQQVSNLSITTENLTLISSVFMDRLRVINVDIPEDDNSGKRGIPSYIIRFDNKGYRVFSIEDVIRYFNQAIEIERIIITIETGESLRSNRQMGSLLELRLDLKDKNASFLTVTSDDRDWVDASFSAVQDVLAKFANGNKWARTSWMVFCIQILGVATGFILSLWAAAKIAPALSIENAFIFSFLFILLIFSNTWTYLNQLIQQIINNAFPNIEFVRHDKDRLQWVFQTVVGSLIAAIAIYALAQAGTYLLEFLGGLVTKKG